MRRGERWGWICFIGGSVVFTVIGVMNGDWPTFLGGVLFVVGCGLLLVDASQR